MVLRSPASHALRLLPVIVGSVLLHAGAALALVATSSGHARAGVALPTVTLDVETTVEPLLERVLEQPEQPNVEAHEHASQPTHTHDYPVAPDHDAHPHDPSLKHDALGLHADEHHEEAPAQAAPVVTAPADPFAALPRFDMPSGAGAPAHGNVSSNVNAAGSGAGAGGAGHDDDAIVPAAGVQVPARLLSSVVASYPSGARADDVEGDVIVEVVLDRDGQVVDARVTGPAGHGFDEAALAAIRRYRFSPAQRGGHAVRVRMPWTVQFRLR